MIPPELHEEEADILGRIKSGEHIDHYETIGLRKDKRKRNLFLSISPVRDSAGRIVGASKIAFDITERKELELNPV
jgi:PAS domain S-box-containing protein